MASLNVTYQDIDTVKTALDTGQTDLEGILTELKGKVDELVAAGFQTDKASGAFQSAYEEFTSGATKAVGGLEGMRDFLKATSEAFEQLDSDLSSALNG